MYAPLICFTGIDGCGKSTQAKRLARRLGADGWEVVTVWTGGQKTLTGPLVRLGQWRLRAPRRRADRRFVARDESGPGVAEEFTAYLDASHRLFARHRIVRRAWIDLSLTEHAAEIACTVLPHLWQGRAVICDRYIYKSVVNLAVLLNLPPDGVVDLLHHPAVRLVPRPTLYFLLDLPGAVGYGRKTDLPSAEYVERRSPIYRALAARTGMPVVDARQSPDVVEAEVWATVARTLARRELTPPQR